MKYNPVFVTFLFLICGIWLQGCGFDEPRDRDTRFTEEFPAVAEAVENRDADLLLEFADHSDSLLAEYAWRSMAKTEVDSIRLFDAVLQNGSDAAWFALSFHELSDELLADLRDRFRESEQQARHICTVFRRQGGEEELSLLLNQIDAVQNHSECATAAGFLIARTDLDSDKQRTAIELAFDADRQEIRRGLLYGFFRSGLNRPELDSDLHRELMNRWKENDPTDSETDRMMIRIAGLPAAENVLERYSDRELRTEVQLSVELAAAAGYLNSPAADDELIRRLMHHQNPHVQIRLMEALQSHEELSEELLIAIRDEIAGPTRNQELFLTSLELLLAHDMDADWYRRKLDFTADHAPYLTAHSLRIYSQKESCESFLDRLEKLMEEGGVRGLHAVQALEMFWMDHEDDDVVPDRIRAAVLKGAEEGGRSVISGLNPLLTDEELIREEEFEQLNDAYTQYMERDERENSLALKEALEARFPDRFEPAGEIAEKPFRTPDWDRLYEMGTRPHWILETSRGTVEVRLDPYSAPFTVSSIDSLTRARAYDGVVFHRVVRNFVVQGGDFDRRDGYGGPDYRLPTEPSFRSYERGAAGIASSGTDTEGSQFFFMHQWAPHLDGDYTLFGEVTRGMDVVDRLQVGDVVERARMSLR